MPREYCTYDVVLDEEQLQWLVKALAEHGREKVRTIDLWEEQVEDLAVLFLENSLEFLEDRLAEGEENIEEEKIDAAAIVGTLHYISGRWGHHRWKSLADKKKYLARHQAEAETE